MKKLLVLISALLFTAVGYAMPDGVLTMAISPGKSEIVLPIAVNAHFKATCILNTGGDLVHMTFLGNNLSLSSGSPDVMGDKSIGPSTTGDKFVFIGVAWPGTPYIRIYNKAPAGNGPSSNIIVTCSYTNILKNKR